VQPANSLLPSPQAFSRESDEIPAATQFQFDRHLDQIGRSGGLSMPSLRLLQFEMDGNILIVAPQGDCSSLEAATLEAELREILDQISLRSVTSLLVDLQHAPYFGSTMLGGLIKLWRSVIVAGGRLALCNVSPAELDVLSATRLESVWGIYPTRAAGMAALR